MLNDRIYYPTIIAKWLFSRPHVFIIGMILLVRHSAHADDIVAGGL
jgi:hypothetical protein